MPHRIDLLTSSATPRRLRLRLRGAVQGVGMRPCIHGLATQLGLAGFVRNEAGGVTVEIQGEQAGHFAGMLSRNLPPLARVDAVDVEHLPVRPEQGFAILDSVAGPGHAAIVPDVSVCADCLADLFDPAGRFYLYPFVSCSHCGPRFTVARALPYDRARTSMAGFAMCADCARDYHDPGNRRFHAETIACPHCGPRYSHDANTIVAALRDGAIVALKGIGGFHLLCDAHNEAAVQRLRARKRRAAKPFAVMAANLASVERFAQISNDEARLLRDRAAPIVLLPARESAPTLAPSVAPGLRAIGTMLPYAPIHHLLFHIAAGGARNEVREAANDFVLVATSANPGGEPLVADNEAAGQALRTIADLIVTHDRDIVSRADDSVLRMVDGAPSFIRRSRGFAPEPIDLGHDGPCVLAVGAHLKATVTVTRGREAFVSQHIGDLDNAATRRFQVEAARHLLTMLGARPDALACDLHPDFQPTHFADWQALPCVPVQHHAAHVAAIAAEHHVDGALLGVALDGHGYGTDGTAWGGELLRLAGWQAERLGHLAPLALPGGDRAAREPWRMGIAALDALGQRRRAATLFPDVPAAAALAANWRPWPSTASMGRLFDAAAALAGVCVDQTYEGEAAMALETLVDTPRVLPGGFLRKQDQLDFRPLLARLADPAILPREKAELFHGTVIAGLLDWIDAAEASTGIRTIALAGGCMMNRVLSEGLARALRDRGLQPLLARRVPPNDGGLSLGQAVLARRVLTMREAIT
ncbi:carbamoyltransferase HypF [Burkholderia multivorans]|uniref:carbamoyltransferase HypF n=1 Tax=Burkholderia multivorans TaxID=87883 RepID=UPI000CFFB446|nr:carbamoyltransferase HypF [Burkholderia multivorans]PRH18940.1 carbamoyltransferase HypF [Burkholderia multivorans]